MYAWHTLHRCRRHEAASDSDTLNQLFPTSDFNPKRITQMCKVIDVSTETVW